MFYQFVFYSQIPILSNPFIRRINQEGFGIFTVIIYNDRVS